MKFLDLVRKQYDSGKVSLSGIKVSDDFTTTALIQAATSIANPVTHTRKDETKFKFTTYGLADVSGGSYTGQSPNGVQMKIEFMTDALVFEFKTVGSIGTYSVFVDGELTNIDAISTPNGQAVTYVRTEASSGVIKRMRHVEIYGVNTSFGGLFTDAADTVTSEITIDPRPFIYQMGDSYTYGTGAGYVTQAYGSSPAINDFYVFRNALGMDGIAEGIGGSGWNSAGGQIPASRLQNRLLKMNRKPDVVSFALAYNDAAAINTGTNASKLVTSMGDALKVVRDAMHDVPVIHISCATPKGITPQIQRVIDLTYDFCARNDIPVIGISNYVTAANSASYTGTDNVHPNPLGHEFRGLAMARESLMAALEGRSLVPEIKPKGFTVTYIERLRFSVDVKREVVKAKTADEAYWMVKSREYSNPDLRIEIISVV